MPHGHQLAQAVHAAGESGPVSPGTYAIVLSASLSALSELADKLAFYSVPHTVIREPDAPYLGEVTAIGGLKEKLLAALRGGIKTALIPEDNVKDLQDIPENVKNGLEIVPVKWIDQVLDIALESKPVPLTEEEISAAVAASVATAENKATKH